MWLDLCEEISDAESKNITKRTKNDTLFTNPISLLWTLQKRVRFFYGRAKLKEKTQKSENKRCLASIFFFSAQWYRCELTWNENVQRRQSKYEKWDKKIISRTIHILASDVQWKCYVPGNFPNWFFLLFFCCMHYKRNMCK